MKYLLLSVNEVVIWNRICSAYASAASFEKQRSLLTFTAVLMYVKQLTVFWLLEGSELLIHENPVFSFPPFFFF